MSDLEKKLDDLQLDKKSDSVKHELNNETTGSELKSTELESKTNNVPSFLLEKPIIKKEVVEEKTDVATNEIVKIFTGYSILYRYIPEKQEVKERGIGDLIIELMPDSNLYRLRMIRKEIETYACNHYVEPNVYLTKHDLNKFSYIWSTTTDMCDPLADNNESQESIVVTDGQDWKKDAKKSSKQTFICRFKTENISDNFEKMFEKARAHNKSILIGKDTSSPLTGIESSSQSVSDSSDSEKAQDSETTANNPDKEISDNNSDNKKNKEDKSEPNTDVDIKTAKEEASTEEEK
ncbi:Ran-specific GTPase-activating protein 1 [Cucumispora dikerogammari]|nr:Ran-specific GTPase-activating protein 1 [Cucumispora dikerogammari]